MDDGRIATHPTKTLNIAFNGTNTSLSLGVLHHHRRRMRSHEMAACRQRP